ncbi:ABC transporter ATP-binding protein [Desulfovibrio sp.]|uniref:ABC transporter ATP-binding protein n=1 Tax=Desulfovibrio sp. TaxID=885 RepID=UPI0025BB83C6|nr:ABC transporter ATP-binding protein [Desulfovibrio sp.]
MKPIISVEELGKSYTIRHEGQTHYKSLREEIFKLPSRLLRRGGQSREEFWALKDVSFDIMPGDRVGIIGRNGAGKSTLLKLLSRITEPTTGRITLRGRVASLLEVGTGFHPELTGRENIYLNGAILGMSRAEVRRKFDEIVDFAGVEKFLDTPVKRYSSGMYVRLAFAVAAHLEPEILIVDEVLAVGDAKFQKKCLGKMEEAGKEGRTVLFVSHNMAAIRHLCIKGICLSKGMLASLGEISSVISSYTASYTQKDACFNDNGGVEISENRKGKYPEKIFSKIDIRNKDKIQTTNILMGEKISISVSMVNTEKYNDADYCIAFINEYDQWVLSYATWMFNISKVNPQCLELEIDRMLLSPGTYSIYLSSTLHRSGQYLDRVQNAVSIVVEEADIFATGRVYAAGCGQVYIPGTLTLG